MANLIPSSVVKLLNIPERDVREALETKKVPESMRFLFEFDITTESDYYAGKLIPDSTTLAVAARAGRLEFLKWCRTNGHAQRIEKDQTVISYAREQPTVMEWLRSLVRSVL